MTNHLHYLVSGFIPVATINSQPLFRPSCGPFLQDIASGLVPRSRTKYLNGGGLVIKSVPHAMSDEYIIHRTTKGTASGNLDVKAFE
jgi:hypothetical protein